MSFKNYVKLIKSSGKWAVVTGSTDGIGREYCRQLAKLGINIFLIGRDKTKLESTSKELKQYYKIDVDYFQMDFTLNSEYDQLSELLKDLDIGVLVNNVGMTQIRPSVFSDEIVNRPFLLQIINCNIQSVISMTKIILDGMMNRKRGIIINISSASSIFPMQMSAMYSSTKAFVTHFSRTIHDELSRFGITVQTVRPFFVQTKFIGNFHPRFGAPSAEEYVESAIKTIGIESDTFGTISHSIQGIIVSSLPMFIVGKFSRKLQEIRRIALSKNQ